jgi:hypothetical protein
MSGESKGQRPGGLWDWPVGVIVAGAFLLVLSAANGAKSYALPLLLIAFGVVSLMIRRGAFTPRK